MSYGSSLNASQLITLERLLRNPEKLPPQERLARIQRWMKMKFLQAGGTEEGIALYGALVSVVMKAQSADELDALLHERGHFP